MLHVWSFLVKPWEDVVKDYVPELQTILTVSKSVSNSHDVKVKYWLDSYIVVIVLVIAPSIILAYQVLHAVK